ncbi:methyl-CpG-binding domain-containing protein 10-like [Cornus florida]|uniref:methyl-CpG-binding domain-containing protein 10-like n=1 Tax=Cornus florida TaxID=4283 RepID=UPI0028A222D0|nr:methyl-CpG-binding domain-containing protein 10-like [Cornus florida]
MASKEEMDTNNEQEIRGVVVAIDLPAPSGWTKKFTPKKSGTPRKNDIVFVSPTGEEITNKRQLDQYLKSHPGSLSVSEFNWGTGDTPRRSARISEKSKATETPEPEPPKKKQKKSSSKKGAREKKDNYDGEGETAEGRKAVTEETKACADVEMKDAEDAGNLNKGEVDIEEALAGKETVNDSDEKTEMKIDETNMEKLGNPEASNESSGAKEEDDEGVVVTEEAPAGKDTVNDTEQKTETNMEKPGNLEASNESPGAKEEDTVNGSEQKTEIKIDEMNMEKLGNLEASNESSGAKEEDTVNDSRQKTEIKIDETNMEKLGNLEGINESSGAKEDVVHESVPMQGGDEKNEGGKKEQVEPEDPPQVSVSNGAANSVEEEGSVKNGVVEFGDAKVNESVVGEVGQEDHPDNDPTKEVAANAEAKPDNGSIKEDQDTEKPEEVANAEAKPNNGSIKEDQDTEKPEVANAKAKPDNGSIKDHQDVEKPEVANAEGKPDNGSIKEDQDAEIPVVNHSPSSHEPETSQVSC